MVELVYRLLSIRCKRLGGCRPLLSLLMTVKSIVTEVNSKWLQYSIFQNTVSSHHWIQIKCVCAVLRVTLKAAAVWAGPAAQPLYRFSDHTVCTLWRYEGICNLELSGQSWGRLAEEDLMMLKMKMAVLPELIISWMTCQKSQEKDLSLQLMTCSPL